MTVPAAFVRRFLPSTVLVATFTACAFRYFRIVNLYAVNVFVGDQWIYHEPTLFHRASLWSIFRWESNPWREGLGGVLSVLVEPLFHWNSRIESFVDAGIIVASCLLWILLKRRLTGSVSVLDSLIPLIVMIPSTHQTIVGVTHFSHGPLPFLLLTLIAWSWALGRSWKYALISFLTGASISTGFGLIAGIAVPLIILLEIVRSREDRGVRIAALAFIAVAWVLFLNGYSSSNTGCPVEQYAFIPATRIYYLLFAVFMFANSLSVPGNVYVLPALIVGGAVLVLVIAVGWRSLKSIDGKSPFPSVCAMSIIFSLIFAFATAGGRMCVGLGAAFGSRYVIYLVPALLGCYFSLSMERRPLALATLAVLVVFGSGWIHESYRSEMRSLSAHRSQWKSCYLKTRDLKGCNDLTHASLLTFPDIIGPQLGFLEEHRLNLFEQ